MGHSRKVFLIVFLFDCSFSTRLQLRSPTSGGTSQPSYPPTHPPKLRLEHGHALNPKPQVRLRHSHILQPALQLLHQELWQVRPRHGICPLGKLLRPQRALSTGCATASQSLFAKRTN